MDNQIFQKLRSILKKTFKVEDDKIKGISNLKDDLGLDSVDLMDVICLVEDEFKIKIIEEEMQEVKWPETVEALINLIQEKMVKNEN